MVQLHPNKCSETAETLIFFDRFPVRLETPICSTALVKEWRQGFSIRSNVAVTTRVSANKKDADISIKGIFKPE